MDRYDDPGGYLIMNGGVVAAVMKEECADAN